MELLLNLTWLLLALPAYWLWRGSHSTGAGHKFSSRQCLLALGCALVILFPVVSATDDLRAMRAEMEESPASKRCLRQGASDKSPNRSAGWQTPAAVAAAADTSVVIDVSWRQPSRPSLQVKSAPSSERAGRAPPTSFLA